ncbi:MAG: hypothetical protein ACRD3Q_20425 [Terriglobales bacterium]
MSGALSRRQVGDTETYHGHKVRALFVGPDLLAEVGDVQLSDFYLNVEAAHAAGRRYVDQLREAFAAKMAKA